jgi:hypothetical protein
MLGLIAAGERRQEQKLAAMRDELRASTDAGSASSTGRPGPDQRQIRDRFAALFAGDGADPNWTPSAESDARDRLTALLPQGSRLDSIECRTQLCRIETTHASVEAYNRFVHAVFLDQGTQVWNSSGFSSRVDDGPYTGGGATMVTFVGHPGQDLPAIND